MEGEPRKPGRYRLGSALIWAAALGALGWHLGDGFFEAAGAAVGGLVAGWTTASLLGWIARFGAGMRTMVAAGLGIGVAIASGAVGGLSLLAQAMEPGKLEVDWGALAGFILSGSILPTLVLGPVTGIYVRSRVPKADRTKGEPCG